MNYRPNLAARALVIAMSEEDPEPERQEIEPLMARRVDALILASTQTAR